MEEDFWSGPVQSYNSPVEHRFLIGLDRSTNGPLPDCDRTYVSVRTMPPGFLVNRLEDPWPVSRCCLEPRWFVGDPTSLAHNNIYVILYEKKREGKPA